MEEENYRKSLPYLFGHSDGVSAAFNIVINHAQKYTHDNQERFNLLIELASEIGDLHNRDNPNRILK